MGAGDPFRVLARELRSFERRDVVVKELRDEIRKPVPQVRAAIKANTLATLPKRGGLNVWVANIKITAAVTLRGKAAGVRLRGGRRSIGSQSDVAAINRGRVRHPSWGRRFRGQWHTQMVRPEFFTKPARESTEWPDAIGRAVDKALEQIRG